MLPYMDLLPLSDDEVERLDAADAVFAAKCKRDGVNPLRRDVQQ